MGIDPAQMGGGGAPGGAPGGGGPPGGAPGGGMPDPMALMALAKLQRRKHATKNKHKGKRRK